MPTNCTRVQRSGMKIENSPYRSAWLPVWRHRPSVQIQRRAFGRLCRRTENRATQNAIKWRLVPKEYFVSFRLMLVQFPCTWRVPDLGGSGVFGVFRFLWNQ